MIGCIRRSFPTKARTSPGTGEFLTGGALKAVVYAGEGRVELADVPRPRLADPRDALVRVTAASVCGSDLHVLSGKTPGMGVGSIIGHEFVGVVEERGAAVHGLSEGERVVGSFLIACGECDRCSQRRFNLCRSGRALGLGSLTGDLPGSQAEYVVVPGADLNLHRLDHETDVDDEHALFAGDILATAFYALSRAELEAGENVVVVGAGPVGVLCALAARARNAARVLLVDTDLDRVRFARDVLGLDAIDASGDDPRAAVAAATQGDMADVVFEAVGAVPAFKSALALVRAGGRVVVVGVYGKDRVEMSLGRAFASGIDLRFCGMSNVQGHWDEALDAVRAKTLDPTTLITHRLALDDAVEAYELFGARRALKVVLRP